MQYSDPFAAYMLEMLVQTSFDPKYTIRVLNSHTPKNLLNMILSFFYSNKLVFQLRNDSKKADRMTNSVYPHQPSPLGAV